MKTWLQTRINWLNNNIGSPSNCMNINLPNLVISKIHYNPKSETNFTSDELEFIEITNNSNETINLTGVYIRELGIIYKFPVGSVATPNQKIILSSNPTKFTQFYGFAPFGGYIRTLSNKSYRIVLSDAFGNIIDEVNYSDSAPWPTTPDGTGPHLCLNNLNLDNSFPVNWSTCENLSIDIQNQESKVSIYPNPIKEQFYISNKENTIKEISILDLQGRKVFNKGHL